MTFPLQIDWFSSVIFRHQDHRQTPAKALPDNTYKSVVWFAVIVGRLVVIKDAVMTPQQKIINAASTLPRASLPAAHDYPGIATDRQPIP